MIVTATNSFDRQYSVMMKWDIFAMKEMDLKFNKTVDIFLSADNFRNPAVLCENLNIELRYTVDTVPLNIHLFYILC